CFRTNACRRFVVEGICKTTSGAHQSQTRIAILHCRKSAALRFESERVEVLGRQHYRCGKPWTACSECRTDSGNTERYNPHLSYRHCRKCIRQHAERRLDRRGRHSWKYRNWHERAWRTILARSHTRRAAATSITPPLHVNAYHCSPERTAVH